MSTFPFVFTLVRVYSLDFPDDSRLNVSFFFLNEPVRFPVRSAGWFQLLSCN